MRGGLKARAQGFLRYRLGVDVGRWPPKVAPDLQLLLSLLATLEVDTVLDIGAHRGESGVRLRRAGFEGRLISFEPAPSAFRVLEQVAQADPRWTTVPMALGSDDGERELEVRQASWLSSFLPSNEFGLAIDSEARQVEARAKVPVRRLDSILDAYTRGPVFAKIDTQGYELEVIRGAAGILSRILGLHVELAIQHQYHAQPDYLTVLEELRGLGFLPAGFFSESADRDGALIEINGLFARRS